MTKLEELQCDRRDAIKRLLRDDGQASTSKPIKARIAAYNKLLVDAEAWLIKNISHPEALKVAAHCTLLKSDIIHENYKLSNAQRGLNPWGNSEECMGITALPYSHSKER